MKNRNKGITLVALVITIIVLIILAGVSINAVMNDGLIQNSKDASNAQKVGKIKEEIEIIRNEVIMAEEGLGDKENLPTTAEELITILVERRIVKESEITVGENDENGNPTIIFNNIIIPIKGAILPEEIGDITKIAGITISNGVLDTIIYSGTDEEAKTNLKNSLPEKLVIPDTVSRIATGAFMECGNIKELVLPAGVSFEMGVFYGCTGLEKVTALGDVSFDNAVFGGCSSLKTVIINGNYSSRDSSPFEGCSALETVTIAGDIPLFQSGEFYGCTNLKNVTINGDIGEVWAEPTFTNVNSACKFNYKGTEYTLAEFKALLVSMVA